MGGDGWGDPWIAPAQLPADLAAFAGRAEAVERLDAVLPSETGTVVIAAIAGSAGIGKTALAVHWAHQVAHRFADGQLYVDLRGYDPGGPAVTAAEALRGFLAALGVPPQRVPARVEDQAGLYRSLLSGRRVLVVLDNARDAEQVRPLLPGAPGCLAVVTSRTQLSGLVAVDGAHPLTLDLLSTEESRELLAGRLGRDRVAADPAATERIIARCARLPLALAVVAARGATYPWFSLAALADELTGGLDAFAAADSATDIRAVFSWSYRHLSPAQARLFRLLGLHPGPDVTLPAAASLAGLPLAEVRALLGGLARAHLITEHTPGRYTLHDLLRQYAAELAGRQDSERDRRFAVHRVLDHYLETAHAAARLIEPHNLPWEPVVVRLPGVVPEPIETQARALAWFAAERAVLLGCLRCAGAHELDAHVWRIAAAVADFFDRQGHWHDWASSAGAALDAAIRLGDKSAQAHVHRSRARALTWLCCERDADAHLRRALDLFGELGDDTGRAHTHRTRSWLLGRQGAHDAALDHAEQALALYRAAGDRAGEALGLNSLGWQCAQVGDYWRARTASSLALALFTESGDHNGAAHALDSLGYVHHQLGDRFAAISCYSRAVDLYRQTGDRYYEADSLIHLGDTHHAAGDTGAAVAAWRRAVEILDLLRHPDAEPIRARLPAERRSTRPHLSAREHAVLVAYVSGMTLTQAARHVGVRPETAKTYLARVKEKYDQVGRPARTKLELADRAREDHLRA